MAKKHITKKDLKNLHHEENGADDGACLTLHEKDPYRKDKSCSYRWQAHAISKKKRKGIYNGVTFKDGQKTYRGTAINNTAKKGLQTSAYSTKKGEKHPASYVSHLPPPKKGDWDLDGPPEDLKPRTTMAKDGRTEIVKKECNFTKDRWPYWHNAHHLIPKALLNEMIDGTGQGGKANREAPSIVRKCLLEAKYNIHQYHNMIILPQDREVGKILGLPRHLILIRMSGKKEQIREAETASHKAYDSLVRADLKKIMDDFLERIHEQDCEDPKDVQLSKAALVELSKKLYQKVTRFGRSNAGDPLADMNPDPPEDQPAPEKTVSGKFE